MKKIAWVTAALGALMAIGAESPAMAAVGQCFDARGRPFGPPHNTDNPPYGMICDAYRRGGYCTGVQPSWAQNNCGFRPRYNYGPYYDRDRYYRRDYYRY